MRLTQLIISFSFLLIITRHLNSINANNDGLLIPFPRTISNMLLVKAKTCSLKWGCTCSFQNSALTGNLSSCAHKSSQMSLIRRNCILIPDYPPRWLHQCTDHQYYYCEYSPFNYVEMTCIIDRLEIRILCCIICNIIIDNAQLEY